MSKELQELTNGTYTLRETGVENQFFFFRNDHEVLGNVGTSHMELFAKYLIEKSQKGEIQQSVYEGRMSFEISNDGKIIRLTVSENLPKKPNLHIVKEGEKELPGVAKPNPFKRAFKKWFGK